MKRTRSKPIRTVIAFVALALIAIPSSALASSHREAPLISQDPAADNTDLYAFVSPDRPDTVTIVANYIPLEEPAGGPNFSNFDPNVRYEIKIDNNGDGVADVTYRFKFSTSIQNPNTFLYNAGPITSLTAATFNYRQTYTVTKVRANTSMLLNKSGQTLRVPPANIGPRSTPHYGDLAATAVYEVKQGVKVFAGPRDDPFFVDLGSIFDLGGLRPFNAAHVLPLSTQPGVDGVGGFNTHSIAIQVPIGQLTSNGLVPTSSDDPHAAIGIWASSSRQTTRVLNANGTVSNSGAWQQVSRLGNPLINEVIIPVGHKDYWNASQPKNDSQFAQYYLNPELAGLVNVLYPSIPDTRTTNRQDLVAILLTGLPLPGGHNLTFTGTTKADELRLNVAIPPCTADDPSDVTGQCNRLGVLGSDLAGFPNGRRLTDDVTDIELRAIADGYGSFVNSIFGSLTPNHTPNNLVGDGVNANDMPFMTAFPYVAIPNQGYVHTHHAIGSTNTGLLQ